MEAKVRFDVLTLFPAFFEPVLGDSILCRARDANLLSVKVHNLRDWSRDEKHRKVDDRPYGGGPGMVLKPEPVIDAVEDLLSEGPAKVILTTPAGRLFNQPAARGLVSERRMIIICGHYEGFDERIRRFLQPDEISIGDYVLTGGELPALVIIDAVTRLIPGVLGDPASNVEDSFTNELLDHPHYTRPESFRGIRVPEVLISGDHGRIAEWRLRLSEERTRQRRPGAYARYIGRKRDDSPKSGNNSNGRREQ